MKVGHLESVQLGIFEISGLDVHSSVYSTCCAGCSIGHKLDSFLACGKENNKLRRFKDGYPYFMKC